jgi:uncharacterized protein (DUF1697 family)
MAQLVALLRGINVGRNKRLAMADLRALMVDIGYEDARTHLQSGNVVFSASERPAAAAQRIEEALARDAGMDVAVLVRTRTELARLVRRNPLRAHATDPKRHLVVFLSAKPDPKRLRDIDPAAFEPERFEAHGREIYVWFPDGMQSAQLGHAFWEKRLGVTATGRNWNTVEKLLALADE